MTHVQNPQRKAMSLVDVCIRVEDCIDSISRGKKGFHFSLRCVYRWQFVFTLSTASISLLGKVLEDVKKKGEIK